MSSGIFYRNIRSRDNLEIFLLAAASAFLLVRLYLHLAHYPELGGGGLHIAHMLWGGGLMLIAIVIGISFLGARALRLSAIIGGVGFGIFIDELGKFITQDNNYFYRPTIGLIYAIFSGLYLGFNFLSRKRKLTSTEYQLNALDQFEEAVVHNMEPSEKARVRHLLHQADPHNPMTHQLFKFLDNVETIPEPEPSRLRRFARKFDKAYEHFWQQRNSSILVKWFFVLEVIILMASLFFLQFHTLHGALAMFHGNAPLLTRLTYGQALASLFAIGFVIYGLLLLPESRLLAFEQFRRATMVNLFLTEFFMFSRIQFGALPGFFGNLLLLAALEYALYQERRLQVAKNQ